MLSGLLVLREKQFPHISSTLLRGLLKGEKSDESFGNTPNTGGPGPKNHTSQAQRDRQREAERQRTH